MQDHDPEALEFERPRMHRRVPNIARAIDYLRHGGKNLGHWKYMILQPLNMRRPFAIVSMTVPRSRRKVERYPHRVGMMPIAKFWAGQAPGALS